LKKVLAIALALVTFTVIFTGCAQPAKQPAAAAPQETAAPAQNGEPKDGAAGKIVTEAVDAKGKLNGWIDGNSVEIQMTPSDATAFWVADVKDQMEGIKDGDMVKFSYKQNEQGQMVITKIEKQ
jgi:Cu/Ag efflux protein CusF